MSFVVRYEDVGFEEVIEFLKNNELSILTSIKSDNLNQDTIGKIASVGNCEILQYNNSDFIELGTTSLEAELHYDGITSKRVESIPDFLFFNFIKNPINSTQSSEFILVDCRVLLAELAEQTKTFLRTNILQLKGAANNTYYESRDAFNIKCIDITSNGEELIRMHLPTRHIGMLSVAGDWITSLSENLSFRFENQPHEKTLSIIFDIHNTINTGTSCYKFYPQDGNLIIVKNKYTLHGREYNSMPVERLLRRTQLRIKK